MDKKSIILETTQGSIEIELMPAIAPKTCENFVGLAQKGYYNGVGFHRVIKDFMIQGGDPDGTGRGGNSIWGKSFEDEVDPNIKFDRKGILAMANAGPNTNRSQFFITTSAERTRHLHMKHTIFGEVVSGYDVVEKIENTPVSPQDNRPLTDQKILRAYLKE